MPKSKRPAAPAAARFGWLRQRARWIGLAALVAILIGAGAGLVAAFDPKAAGPRAIAAIGAGPEALAPPERAGLSEVLVDPSLDADLSADGDGIDPAADPNAPLSAGEAPPLAAQEAPLLPNIRVIGSGQSGAAASPLPKAPLPGLSTPGPNGPLPIIAKDGRTPFSAYRRPSKAEANKPRLAIMVAGLGLNAAVTQQAIEDLPAEVTLAFIPYSANLQTWIDRARANGHEVVLEIPMEAFDPEADDTGPQTLLTRAEARENIARLENLLARGQGYFAVANYQGGRFVASAQASGPIVQALKARGLAFIGNGAPAKSGFGAEAAKSGLMFTAADRIVDLRRSAAAIDEQLLALEALALQNGAALGAGFASPLTITQVKQWSEDIGRRGFVLVPASAIVEKRAPPRS